MSSVLSLTAWRHFFKHFRCRCEWIMWNSNEQ